jgi:hypothetical protein
MEQRKLSVLTEEMFKFVTTKFTIRMWLPLSQPFSECDLYPTDKTNEIFSCDNNWMRSNIEMLIENKWKDLGMSDLGLRLLSAYEANAVEILDKDGNGKVFYNDWP